MIDFCLQSHRPILYLKRQQKVHPAKRFEILRSRQHGLVVSGSGRLTWKVEKSGPQLFFILGLGSIPWIWWGVGWVGVGVGRVQKKLENKGTFIVCKLSNAARQSITNTLGPNFFKSKLTWSKLFQTKPTRRLACLPSFCELVLFLLYWRKSFLWQTFSGLKLIANLSINRQLIGVWN